MERIKATIPVDLQECIGSSRIEDLSSICSSLVDHFAALTLFQELLQQLVDPDATTCAKNSSVVSSWKEDGNVAFGKGDFKQALHCYSQALRYAPMHSQEETATVAVLFTNRAATLHKMRLADAAERDCTRAIDLNPYYSKAWYRRGRARKDLKKYNGSIADMEKAVTLESSAGGKRQVLHDLEQILADSRKLQLDGSCSQGEASFGDALETVDEIERVWTPEKGWGLHSKKDLKPGSSVLVEHPHAAVILKNSRDTHCHFCFEELPADSVPCGNCAMAMYCSDICKKHATSSALSFVSSDIKRSVFSNPHSCPGSLEGHGCSLDEPLCTYDSLDSCKRGYDPGIIWAEHKHECGGASWSFVLPSEAVLAARIFVRCLLQKDCLDNLQDLCHHYNILSSDKVELLVLATVLAYCLQQSLMDMNQVFELTGVTVSKLVLLIAQVRVTAMAVVRISSPDPKDESDSICSVEQIKVAQAVFLTGRLFNHSCDPNLHAAFSSRCLCVRTIKLVSAGSPLELCYGPQVGEKTWMERQKWLKEYYFFICSCSACSSLTISDLVVHGFRCEKADCTGVVLRREYLDGKKQKQFFKDSGISDDRVTQNDETASSAMNSFSEHMMSKGIEFGFGVEKVAGLLYDLKQQSRKHILAGRCLSCGWVLDVNKVSSVADEYLGCLARIEHVLRSNSAKDGQVVLDSALCVLHDLRAVLHAFNKHLAKAEDVIAEIYCELGQFDAAVLHCQVSIQILEKLYNKFHIVVANERLKLASVAVAATDWECARLNFAEAHSIFVMHYGPGYSQKLPYIVKLQKLLLE